jgi:ubiquinone/menaquinone biosynthesis C-methylase UbiE
MDRVLEPEIMDTASEATAYDAMDHSEVNRAFVGRFLDLGGAGRVLDLACGPAHIPIALCLRDPNVRVTAVDAAAHMLAIAERRVRESRLEARIEIVRSDAKRLPFTDHSFDAVACNASIHHLADPRPCFLEIARVVRPGGAILLRDLHRPSSDAELDHLVDVWASEASAEQQGLFADSLRAAFTCREIADLLAVSGLPDLHVYVSSDRHWTAEREGAIVRIEGLVEEPLALRFGDLDAFRDASPGEGGVALETLLARARPRPGATHLVLHGADGYSVSVAIAEVASRAGLLFREGARPLPRERGGPLRFVVPDAATCGRGGVDRCATVKAVLRIEVGDRPGRDSRLI